MKNTTDPSSCTATMDSPTIFTGRNLTNVVSGAIDSTSTPPTCHGRCATTKPTPPTAAYGQEKKTVACSAMDAKLLLAAINVPHCVERLQLGQLAKGERRRAGDAGACALRHLGIDFGHDGELVVPEVLPGWHRCEELRRRVEELESHIIFKSSQTMWTPRSEFDELYRKVEAERLLHQEAAAKNDAVLEELQRVAADATQRAQEDAANSAAAKEVLARERASCGCRDC